MRSVSLVPGIRPDGTNGDDQVRVLTPSAAIERGADYLIVGRPITASPDPSGCSADAHDSVVVAVVPYRKPQAARTNRVVPPSKAPRILPRSSTSDEKERVMALLP